jgi:hypothetical protein
LCPVYHEEWINRLNSKRNVRWKLPRTRTWPLQMSLTISLGPAVALLKVELCCLLSGRRLHAFRYLHVSILTDPSPPKRIPVVLVMVISCCNCNCITRPGSHFPDDRDRDVELFHAYVIYTQSTTQTEFLGVKHCSTNLSSVLYIFEVIENPEWSFAWQMVASDG